MYIVKFIAHGLLSPLRLLCDLNDGIDPMQKCLLD